MTYTVANIAAEGSHTDPAPHEFATIDEARAEVCRRIGCTVADLTPDRAAGAGGDDDDYGAEVEAWMADPAGPDNGECVGIWCR